MASPEEMFDKLIFWGASALVGVVVWIQLRLHSRVDKLEQQKVDKATLDDFKEAMAEHRKETGTAFARVNTTLDHVNATLLQIVQRLPK